MNFVPSNFPDRHLGLPSSHMKNCPEPFGSSPREYFPAEGSFGLFHDVSTVLCPVFVFTLTFIPGRKLSVGCSKLSQIAVPSPDDTTSWPESLIVALVSFVVAVETSWTRLSRPRRRARAGSRRGRWRCCRRRWRGERPGSRPTRPTGSRRCGRARRRSGWWSCRGRRSRARSGRRGRAWCLHP
ncbi:G-type lectin S-receptor-like serine/threonine-protein kinase B120 [Iris pallida]|uniref:G-type lectin S-receptor-like serine/threonine-protein kinase B120 n=1 Tax=Iris pallida TaxID=29817 RepID=A0AAX6HQ84_IRIPA|nr:G-type lectin S-receptor-like serine/threonine-protein kinase B120 [Iris pallida]